MSNAYERFVSRVFEGVGGFLVVRVDDRVHRRAGGGERRDALGGDDRHFRGEGRELFDFACGAPGRVRRHDTVEVGRGRQKDAAEVDRTRRLFFEDRAEQGRRWRPFDDRDRRFEDFARGFG